MSTHQTAPHAEEQLSRIVIEDKTIEWRSKPIVYGGPLLICASKSERVWLDTGKKLPIGAAVGVVDLAGCRPIKKADLKAACGEDWDGPVDSSARVMG